MTFDRYLDRTLDAVAAHLDTWAGAHDAGHTGAALGLAVALVVLWMGTLFATRLVAQASAGSAFALALSWAALVFLNDAVGQLYGFTASGQAVAAVVCFGLMLFVGSRILATSLPRAFGVLCLGGAFAGLGGLVLALFWRLISAI